MDEDKEILMKIKRQREKLKSSEMTSEQWVYHKYGYNQGKVDGIVGTLLIEILLFWMIWFLSYMAINSL